MRGMRRFFDFYLKASVHVAFAVVSLSYVGAKGLNILWSNALGVVLFSGTVMGYNFIKYGLGGPFYLKVTHKSFMPMQILSFFCGALGLYGMLYLNALAYLVLLMLVAFTALYGLPVLPAQKNLRAVKGMKIYIVAFVWALATVILPLATVGVKMVLQISSPSNPFGFIGVLTLFLSHFFLVLALMVPFELRDYLKDTPQLATLPQRHGVKKTKNIGLLWSLLFLGGQLFAGAILKWPLQMVGLSLMITLLLILGIFSSSKYSSSYFTNFWVEGIPILFALLWWVFDSFL